MTVMIPSTIWKNTIAKTAEGLVFSDEFFLELFARLDALDGLGLKEEARALLQEFGVVR